MDAAERFKRNDNHWRIVSWDWNLYWFVGLSAEYIWDS